MLVSRGKLDGEYMRTAVWAERFKRDVVYVPTPVFVDQITAVSLARNNFSLRSLSDLQNYSVAIASGHRWAEAKVAELGIIPTRVNSSVRFMELLTSGQVDLGLVEQSVLTVLPNLSELNADPISPIPYHIVLRRQYADLIPALDASLQAVLNNGDGQ